MIRYGVLLSIVLLGACSSKAVETSAAPIDFEALGGERWTVVAMDGAFETDVSAGSGAIGFERDESNNDRTVLAVLNTCTGGGSAIDWDETGFTLVSDPNVAYVTDDVRCEPHDDLLALLVQDGLHFDVELGDDASTLTIDNGRYRVELTR